MIFLLLLLCAQDLQVRCYYHENNVAIKSHIFTVQLGEKAKHWKVDNRVLSAKYTSSGGSNLTLSDSKGKSKNYKLSKDGTNFKFFSETPMMTVGQDVMCHVLQDISLKLSCWEGFVGHRRFEEKVLRSKNEEEKLETLEAFGNLDVADPFTLKCNDMHCVLASKSYSQIVKYGKLTPLEPIAFRVRIGEQRLYCRDSNPDDNIDTVLPQLSLIVNGEKVELFDAVRNTVNNVVFYIQETSLQVEYKGVTTSIELEQYPYQNHERLMLKSKINLQFKRNTKTLKTIRLNANQLKNMALNDNPQIIRIQV
eukprot:NODE_551_length_6164_cov_0.432811.p2 type:complete len:309 gc:universal NODE_551_length_6164_cov_0.432811:1440-514(-)